MNKNEPKSIQVLERRNEMCMNPVEVKELCKLTVRQIEICEATEKLPALKEPPYVRPEHQDELTALACIIETLVRSMEGVLHENRRFDIDAINHSFGA